jgi:hypothetical protein
MIEKWAYYSEDYRQRKAPISYRENHCAITPQDIYYFLAITYYMGVVKQGKRKYYWNASRYSKRFGTHPVCDDTISYSRYKMIWRCLSLCQVQVKKNDLSSSSFRSEDTSDSDNSCVEGDGCSSDEDGYEEEGKSDSQSNYRPSPDVRWFARVISFADHVNKVNKKMCSPGSINAIDEQMARYHGRSIHTYRMRGKPIKEGYKIWAIACSATGFCHNFLYASRQKDKFDNTSGKRINNHSVKGVPDTVSVVTQLAKDTLDLRSKTPNAIVMDNYFTWPKVMLALREIGVGAFGTARARKGWPPSQMKKVESEMFNTCHYLTDTYGARVFKWRDNGSVYFVSTVHASLETVEKGRKRPRSTLNTAAHIKEVWGEDYVKSLEIPTFIDDYNQFMGAVDRSDQMMATFAIKHRCYRNWSPLFKHLLDMIRANSWIAYQNLHERSQLDATLFVMGMVDALINLGDEWTPYRKRKRNTSCDGAPGMHTSTSLTKDVTSTLEKSSSISGTPAKTIPFRDLPLANKRIRKGGKIISHTNRFNTSKNHVQIRILGVDRTNFPVCVYCRWLKAHDNLKTRPKRTALTCAACPGIALCRDHFDTYHQREAEEAKSSL